MPALVAGIHVVPPSKRLSLKTDVDGRDEPGHDVFERPSYRPCVCTFSMAEVPERTFSNARLSAAGSSPGFSTFSP